MDTLTSEQLERLREFVKEHGEIKAAELLHVHRTTVLRAAAGFNVRPATAHFLRAQLAGGRPRL